MGFGGIDSKDISKEMLRALPGDQEWESQLAVDTHMQSKPHSKEMLRALPGDQEWESQLAVDNK